MEVTIQNIGSTPEWASQRGHMVEFTMDFFAKGSFLRKGRTLAKQGEHAFVLSNYVNDRGEITVQPMDRYYAIHNVPVNILKSLDRHLHSITNDTI